MSQQVIDLFQTVIIVGLFIQVHLLRKQAQDCTVVLSRLLPIVLKLTMRGIHEENTFNPTPDSLNGKRTSKL